MEAHQSQRITNKEQRNKKLSADGGGAPPIPGLLVFGGALVVIGLIATVASFVTNRNKSKPPPPHKPQQSESDHPSSQGIPSLQDSSTNHDNAWQYPKSYNLLIRILLSLLLSSYLSLLCVVLLLLLFIFSVSPALKHQIRRMTTKFFPEEKPGLKFETCLEEESVTSLHQEIVLSDNSPPERTASFNNNGTEEEGLEPSADSLIRFKEVDQIEDQAKTEAEDDVVDKDDHVLA